LYNNFGGDEKMNKFLIFLLAGFSGGIIRGLVGFVKNKKVAYITLQPTPTQRKIKKAICLSVVRQPISTIQQSSIEKFGSRKKPACFVEQLRKQSNELCLRFVRQLRSPEMLGFLRSKKFQGEA